MRKLFTITFALLVGNGIANLAQAQESDYQPLVREGVKWVNSKQYVYSDFESYYFGPIENYCYALQGDTTITTSSGTYQYKKVSGHSIYLREVGTKVYILDKESLYDNQEYLLYDFSDQDVAKLYTEEGDSFIAFALEGTVDIDGRSCRVYRDDSFGLLVESIGLVSHYDGDLLHPRWWLPVGGMYNYGLDHVEDLAGNIIYVAPWYEAPANCKPLVREGVIWHYAYEDFAVDGNGQPDMSTYHIIDHKMEFRGDTTIYGITYKKCYFYETDELASNESPAILAREDNGKVLFAPVAFDETAYWGDDDIFHPLLTILGPYSSFLGEYIAYDFGDMPGFMEKLKVLDSSFYPELMATTTTHVGDDQVDCYQTNIGDYVESVGLDGRNTGYLDDPYPERPTCTCPGVKGLIMLTDLDGKVLYKGRYYNEYSSLEQSLNESLPRQSADPRWYNLMGQPFDSQPTIPGIYIHQGKKVVVK